MFCPLSEDKMYSEIYTKTHERSKHSLNDHTHTHTYQITSLVTDVGYID